MNNEKLFRTFITATFILVVLALVGYFVMQIIWALYHDLPPARADYVDYVNFIFTVITMIVGLVGIFSVYNSSQAKSQVTQITEKTEKQLHENIEVMQKLETIANEKLAKYENLKNRWEDELQTMRDNHANMVEDLEKEINTQIAYTSERLDELTKDQDQISDIPLLHAFLTNQASNLISTENSHIQKMASAISILKKISHSSPLIRMECVLALSQISEYELDVYEKIKHVAQRDPVPEIRRIAQAAIDAADQNKL